MPIKIHNVTSVALTSLEIQSNTTMPEYNTYLETYNFQLNSVVSFDYQGAMKSKICWLYKSNTRKLQVKGLNFRALYINLEDKTSLKEEEEHWKFSLK